MEICTHTVAQKQGRHTGWSDEEDALLFKTASLARERGLALKSVFDEVASATGRKPNSVRNYYYARVKQDGNTLHSAAFVPFTPDEVRSLVRAVLTAQAGGVSVRSCTLDMGGGDTQKMLRYQNKYRAVVKNDPALVRSVMEEMCAEGAPCFDPYIKREPAGKQRGFDRREAAAFFEALESLAARYRRLVT